MIDQKFKDEIYQACLISAHAMGEDIKTLSWFGKNHISITHVNVVENNRREAA